MSRIKILQPTEIRSFDTPIFYNLPQKLHFFSITDSLRGELNKLRHPCSKMGFLLQCGYFMYHGRFFEVADFRKEDIEFVAKQLKLNINQRGFHKFYIKQIAYKHRELILRLFQWKPFNEQVLKHQIIRLVEQQQLPRKVLWDTKSYMYRQRIEAPAYDKYLKTINDALLRLDNRINESLKTHLTQEHCDVIDEFMVKKAPYQPAEIVQYKSINQSSQPNSIKKSVELFINLKKRLEKVQGLINNINLSDATIDYHAHWATIAESDKIEVHMINISSYSVF